MFSSPDPATEMTSMTSESKQTQGSAATGALVTFNFDGDDLAIAYSDGEPHAVLARLCEPLELDTKSQRDKIKTLSWARWGIIPSHDASGRPQDLFCLSLRSVAGWLFTVNAGKVAPHLREKLAKYQRECADVLADHFLGKRGAETHGLSEVQVAAIVRREVSAAMQGAPSELPARGKMGPAGANGALARIRLLAGMWVTAKRAKSMRSALMSIQQILRGSPGIDWGGKGCSWEDLPGSREPALDKVLSTMESEARAWSKAAGVPQQSDLFVHGTKRRAAPANDSKKAAG